MLFNCKKLPLLIKLKDLPGKIKSLWPTSAAWAIKTELCHQKKTLFNQLEHFFIIDLYLPSYCVINICHKNYLLQR